MLSVNVNKERLRKILEFLWENKMIEKVKLEKILTLVAELNTIDGMLENCPEIKRNLLIKTYDEKESLLDKEIKKSTS